MEEWVEEVRKRTEKIPIASGRSNKLGKISFEDLVFVPAQLSRRPIDYFKEKISAETVIGRRSQKPIKLQTPILIGAMSFGALSKEAKIALAKASALAGTIANTGEGGMLPEERKEAKYLIVQYSTGRFGISEEVLKQADAIEIKIGQGAKPGQGGLLPKEKLTEEILEVRKVKPGQDVHSPAYHPDIKDIKDLRAKIEWLRKISGGVPIIIKLGAADIEKDIELGIRANPDVIAIDGMEGGTGAAPEIMLNDFGIPTLAALIRARKALDRLRARQELWIGGGLSKGADFAKALALGADAVFVSFPLLIAMGCAYCRLCWTGKCPKGVATQDKKLREQFNIQEAAEKVARFVKNCTEEIKMAAGACGEDNIHNLKPEYLRSLNWEFSQATGIKHVAE